MIQYGVILFHTTSSVMRTEKLLLKAGVKIKLVPTPREFSSDCGISIRFEWAKYEPLKVLLEEERVEFEAIYPLSEKSG
ncbi:MAG: DUF3343 domain-containing protein [Dehalococcoidales bacterium]|nr:DUF3343 domain-containing protein [Dehalococcoidales bacterium]